jgi:hypothetical protein
MASEAAHVAVANRNQATINFLCADFDRHSAWIATIAFYKALHLVEAAFANDPAIGHVGDHLSRFECLKKAPSYQHVYRHYGPLFRASLLARYLEDSRGHQVPCFDAYLPPAQVQATLLFHHLKQIEQSVGKRLAQPAAVLSVDSARPHLPGKGAGT